MRDKFLVFGVLAAIPIVPVLLLGVLILTTQESRTAPPAVISLIATDTSYGRNGQVDLAWTPTDVKDFAYYSIYASKTEITDVADLSPIDQIDDRTTATYQVTKYWADGLSLALSAIMEDTEYWFAVTAVDLDGNESELITSISATIELMPQAPSVFIKLTNNTGFQPETVTVPVGTTVSWDRHSARTYRRSSHTVTSDTGLFHYELTSNDPIFIYTFTEAGVYGYHCEFHDDEAGTIIVE